MIRTATHDDIPRIIEMAQAFYATTSYARFSPISYQSAAGLAIITMESGVMLVAEKDGELVGMTCLIIVPFLFNVSLTVAEEIAFWIEPEHRGGMLAIRLLKEIEKECRAKMVDVIRMATLIDSPPQAASLYLHEGYEKSDSHFMKGL